MEALVWIGACVSLLGLAGVIWCILQMVQARRARLPEDEMRARLQRVATQNMAALGISALGLMMVVVGITLA